MTDHGMLYKGAMVRAMLGDRKTQTRRAMKPQPDLAVLEFVKVATETGTGRSVFEMRDKAGKSCTMPGRKHCVSPHFIPRIAIGDRIYVRETWAPISALKHNDPGTQALTDGGFYQADESVHNDEITRWTPAIHQPRKASRLTLIVSDVRIQRLQDISEADAVAEGCFKGKASGRVFNSCAAMHLGGDEWASARDWYADLWESINGAGSWGMNPWVVAYSFTVLKQNIERVSK